MPKSSPVRFSIVHLTTSFPGSLWKRGCALQSNLDLCELNGPDNRKCLSECHATLVGALRESQSESPVKFAVLAMALVSTKRVQIYATK